MQGAGSVFAPEMEHLGAPPASQLVQWITAACSPDFLLCLVAITAAVFPTLQRLHSLSFGKTLASPSPTAQGLVSAMPVLLVLCCAGQHVPVRQGGRCPLVAQGR